MSDSRATQSLLLTKEQAALLLELTHSAAWKGSLVRKIEPVIAQLESIAPSPASSAIEDAQRLPRESLAQILER